MISCIVPVYNSSESLRELHNRITTLLEDHKIEFEIIFVEDCGSDSSWEIINELTENDSRVRGFRMNRNYGQHNALLCGIRNARYEIIATIDDDLQHPPEELPKLLAKLEEGYDVVYGSPERERHGLFRDLASQVTKMVLKSAMGAYSAKQVCAFRVFRTHLRDAFSGFSSPTVNIDVLLTWATSRFTAVSVTHERRKFGKSGYTFRMLIRHAMNMMTGFSTGPLQMASLMGIIFALIGIAILFYVVVKWISTGSIVPGFAFIASMIAVFSGAQLLALGIIGEYIARIHTRTMDQPSYFVSMETKGESNHC